MCQFIPQFMLKEIYVRGDATRKEMAVMTAATDKLAHFHVGQIGACYTLTPSSSRLVHDAENRTVRPGKFVRGEGEESKGDKQVDEAYDYSGATRDFFREIFNRKSIDNKEMDLVSTVHYGKKYPNAFWVNNTMTYGDGDGEIFNPFTILDVCAHELTHGVTEYTANLIYHGESGALNESFSDVFGSLVKQYVLKQKADKADWIIGEGLFTKNINGVGIRSMIAPGTAYDDPKIGKDRQPAHMKDKYEGDEDSGGVHINSSLINKPFAEFAKNLGGFSWEKAGRVWYDVLTTKLNSCSNFQQMVDATQEVVIQNYGTGIEHKALKEAWKTVGLFPTNHIYRQLGS